MTTFLLYDDAVRSPEMRHEIGELVMDPLTFVEVEGRRIVIASNLEVSVLERREDVIDDVWNIHDLGVEELVTDSSFPHALVGPEVVRRALDKLGVSAVCVPPTFRIQVADYLRDKGVEVTVDADAWAARRRQKTPAELEGTERAQRAADTAVLAAVRMIREAEPMSGNRLRFEGEVLTCEWIREVMTAELRTQGAASDDIIVQTGDDCMKGHDVGLGPVLPDQSLIIDCFPQDRRSGAFSDMTRTFVPGTPSKELQKLHADCKAALDIAFDALRPGRADAYRAVAEHFHSQGYPTQLRHDGAGPLVEGFSHSLGHGVGLEVHERPWIGRRADELVEGDVIAVEPGLYFRGIGGVRLEDTVVVTSSGVEHFTDPFPYDLQP
ncbi:MAG TPA: M24 family metallopeptidase [Actinomycetota bacterium]|jgi:Xaa-Pro aminopeptidase